MIIKLVAVVVLMVSLCGGAVAQDTLLYEEDVYEYESEEWEESVDSQQVLKWANAQKGQSYVRDRPEQGNRSTDWNTATRELDFSKDQPKKQREEIPRTSGEPNWEWLTEAFSGLGTLLQVLAIALAAAGIGYGIYFLLRQPRNRQISKSGVEITWENLDQFLDETELERFLQEALRNKAWPQAIRVYFLMSIQALSDSKAIRWARDKTNRAYLLEMRSHPLAEAFRNATLQYEQVWYGNHPVNESQFKAMEPVFVNLLRSIKP
jgi:hypothetical protein